VQLIKDLPFSSFIGIDSRFFAFMTVRIDLPLPAAIFAFDMKHFPCSPATSRKNINIISASPDSGKENKIL
jgi:hypothetical protein